MSIIGDLVITATKGKRNSRRRWYEEAIIPQVVLTIIWDDGIMFCDKPPAHGMELKTFLDLLLKRYDTPDKETEEKKKEEEKDAALHLYIDTVQSEIMHDWRNNVRPKKIHLKWPAARQGGSVKVPVKP